LPESININHDLSGCLYLAAITSAEEISHFSQHATNRQDIFLRHLLRHRKLQPGAIDGIIPADLKEML
jgi:hypothetical protein